MWIEREIQEIWDELEREYGVLVITGSRQVGKSALLSKLYGANQLVSLDLPRLANEAQNSPELFLKNLKTPVVIDEVQYAPNLFRAIKHEVDKLQNSNSLQKAQWLLTGSEKFSLMEGVSESLAGRAGILELGTLSLRELEKWSGEVCKQAKLLQWMLEGGYPKLHAQKLNRDRFFSNLVATYLERDVKRLLNVQSLFEFDKFMRLCALRSGQLLSMSNIASDLGVSQTTIKKWISTLEASGIVDLIEPWHLNPNKRLVKTPKLYFNDTGLCLHLIGISTIEELQRSVFLGPIFETLCYGQLKRYFNNRGLKKKIYFFRTHDGEEIDFVLTQGTEHILYECKFSENPTVEKKGRNAFEKYSQGRVKQFIFLNSGRKTYCAHKNAEQEPIEYMQSCVDAGMPVA
jgi:uncharacterized protein